MSGHEKGCLNVAIFSVMELPNRSRPVTIFTFESWTQWLSEEKDDDDDDNGDHPTPAGGYENVTPIARNDIPLVGHWCMKQLSIDNVSQSRGGYAKGCITGPVVITWNCVKFLLHRPEGLASSPFDAG